MWLFEFVTNVVGDVQCQPRLSSITKTLSMQISQSDCSIQIKLNYLILKSTIGVIWDLSWYNIDRNDLHNYRLILQEREKNYYVENISV